MATREEKKETIRNQIIAASHVYRDHLAGRVFLYVTGSECFEVVFQSDRFLHLTGVSTRLSAKDFYEKAKESRLATGQIAFDSRHPYDAARKKLPCLLMLPALTNSLVCVVKDLATFSLTYRLGVTNLDFTIGLTENVDFQGNKINSWFLPRTLRVRDKAIERSSNAEFVDFIFSKDASREKYDTLTYAEPGKSLPPAVLELLIPELAETCSGIVPKLGTILEV